MPPSETHPNVHAVRDFGANGCCKEQSDRIAIATLAQNAHTVIRYLARLKNGNIEMKSKEKPPTRPEAYFVVRDRL